MEKLELHHISPYLPYGLKFINPEHKHLIPIPMEIISVENFHEKGVYVKSQIDGDFHYSTWTKNFGYMPILRPLSDLAKEIEHISSTIELEPSLQKIKPNELFKKHWHLTIREDGLFSVNNGDGTCTGFKYMSSRYDVLLLLFEWHFDVFGLIEKGLAIDINTL